jgi:adenine-specific DNA glycosylase
VRHVFTHRDLTAEVFSVATARASSGDAERRWVARDELADLGVSSFTRKTLAAGSPPLAARTTRKRDKRREPA